MQNVEQTYNLIISNFKLFLAIVFRVGGLVFTAPFFGHRSIHFLLKIGLVFLISLIILPVFSINIINLPNQLPSFILVLVREAVIGALIGILFYLLFWGIEMGGNLLGLQLNLDADNQEEGSSPIARLQVFLGLLIFLGLNGHHLLISAIFQSFELIPVGELKLASLALEHVWQFSGSVFLIALKISAPVIVTLFILDLLLGILSRTTPQSNLYSNFIPLRLGAGLLILALSFPVFKTIIEKLLLNTNSQVTQVLKSLK
jgi:flagellar biosynthetic protein FliR